MNLKKITYYFSRFTLLDELLALAYWILAIVGLVLLFDEPFVADGLLLVVAAAYIVAVVLFYIFVVKKIKQFFGKDAS